MNAATRADVQPFARRGVCPALSAPMQTGDGLLSRIALTAHVSPDDLGALCTLAVRHGNGLVDITARGSLQFRGLTTESAVSLEMDVLALGLPLRHGLAVETSPLAGIDETAIADTGEIVSRICERADQLHLHERLAAKMSVVVDGGGNVIMDDLLADIRLKAVRLNNDVFWQLMLGGSEANALRVGSLHTENAADAVTHLLSHLAERGSEARGRDLDIAQIQAICADWLIQQTGDAQATALCQPFGLLRLSENLFATVLAPAYGQLPAKALSSLCAFASTLGMKFVKPGPAHALFFLGDEVACQALLDHAPEAGFVTRADDPRSAIAVCAGKSACASGFLVTKELADHAAVDCAPLLDSSLTLHLSGCGKGCAHPNAAPLAFSGRAEGLAFTYSGRAGDPPDVVLPFSQQEAALSRLARLYEKEHKPGENAHTLLARLGKDRIVAALRQEDR
ncbi:precorrin-3B synthase [Agrobacterium bohemicum]|uniref:Precorrin-3B synthase n=2 Tax=Agrobacterium bohemicum TaxID=2052828 RepID=A0A135P249_9HYPH|nr:precorrin-3B synthase [Agrobacterium bohemicum]KXG85505.1 precorrin-3B synthase [Agrobacterium bohemicum]